MTHTACTYAYTPLVLPLPGAADQHRDSHLRSPRMRRAPSESSPSSGAVYSEPSPLIAVAVIIHVKFRQSVNVNTSYLVGAHAPLIQTDAVDASLSSQ